MELAVTAPPAVSAALERVLANIRAAWRPPARRKLSEWADEFFYLSKESSHEVGRWKTLPYQRGIMDAISDPLTTSVTLMKSARVGYTKILDATCGYYMHQDPCGVMVVQPTIEDAQGFSKEEIAPMLRDCPQLLELVSDPKAKDGDNTILHKVFRNGGSLSMVGANSPRGFRRVSRKVVLFDEIDGYPISAGPEGDPIRLGERRAEYFWDRKYVYGSTATLAGASRIERKFFAGDQRRYYVPCPHCGYMQVLVFEHFKWPKGKPELATYGCIDCGAEIEHGHQREMVEAGEWRPGPHAQFPDDPPPPPFDGHVSFHIWAAYSFSPNATWGQICHEYAEAEKAGDEELKTVFNTVLGKTWRGRGDAPEWERLYARREAYAIGSCPRGVLFLTMGVDVQKDRLVYEVVGWGRRKQSWSVDTGVLAGDTSNDAVWQQLEAFFARTYQSETGVALPISVMAVDSGFNTQTVYNWCRQRPLNQVIAVRGVATAKVLLGPPSPVDVSVSGRKLPGSYKVWPVSPDVAKGELYGWLNLPHPTDQELEDGATFGPGFCRFPQYGEEYFKQLTAEQLVLARGKYIWVRIPGRENHQLDCRVYARAAAAHAGIDRFQESDWEHLERSTGHLEPLPAPDPTREPEPPRGGGGWIKPRPGGFIRRR